MGERTDFNDLAAVAGLEAVRTAVDKALATPVDVGVDADRLDAPVGPPRMPDEGFPGLLMEVVKVACANSEAHPVTVAANVMAMFCAMVGRGPFQRIGDAVVHCRPYALVVGKSGKARKGTGEHTPREIARRGDLMLRERLKTDDRLRIHAGGLSTGEGVAWAIRDEVEPDEAGKGGDKGVHDKRLLVIEAEFDNLLSQVRREGNTLSAVVRNLWDGRDLEPLTKTARTRATRPHVVVLGHVTSHELREKCSENDAANGLLNRFLVLYVYRPKLVPLPEPTPEAQLMFLAKRLADAVEFATHGDFHGNNTHEVAMGDDARTYWCECYPRLTRDRDRKGGSLMARTEVYARMLAMIFCLMDRRREIEPCDLVAALAWVEYWRASVTYVFGGADDDGALDKLALIKARPGIKLSEVQTAFGGDKKSAKAKQVKASIERLMNLAPPLVECRRDEGTGGRAALRYFAP